VIGYGGSDRGTVSDVYVHRFGAGETFVSNNIVHYWPASAHVREAEEPPRKPTGLFAGNIPVPVALRAGIVHRDIKPANRGGHAPRMRRPHQRGQGPA